jgi:hypothetical protein
LSEYFSSVHSQLATLQTTLPVYGYITRIYSLDSSTSILPVIYEEVGVRLDGSNPNENSHPLYSVRGYIDIDNNSRDSHHKWRYKREPNTGRTIDVSIHGGRKRNMVVQASLLIGMPSILRPANGRQNPVFRRRGNPPMNGWIET